MSNGVLFVERSGELCLLARLRDTIPEPQGDRVLIDVYKRQVYEMYYAFSEPISRLAGHRILALNRGEKEKILTVKVEAPREDILRYLEKQVIIKENKHTAPCLLYTSRCV